VNGNDGARAPVGTAAITTRRPVGPGVSVVATGAYEPGIGRVGFVLIDLAGTAAANVVDRKDVGYGAPLPTRVSEAWRTGPLTPGTAYRVFFHVYDRTGVNLVAYDREDFITSERSIEMSDTTKTAQPAEAGHQLGDLEPTADQAAQVTGGVEPCCPKDDPYTSKAQPRSGR
jgi:hypothetical protein